MKKHLGCLSLVLATVMLCFAACSASPNISGGIKFSDRKYLRVELSEVSEALDQAVELSKNVSNGNEVLSKIEIATGLFFVNQTNNRLAQIYSDLDTTNTYWVEEQQYCYDFYQKSYKLIREAEKQIFVSPVAPYCLEVFGPEYIESVLNEKLNKPEQDRLLLDESKLSSQYSALYGAKKEAEVEQLYVDLVKVRKKIATTFGYESYSDYAYENHFTRDYTTDQAVDFTNQIKTEFLQIYKDAESLEYYNIYTALNDKQLLNTAEKAIRGLAQPQLTNAFTYLKSNELYDFKVSDKKANTSYVTDLKSYNDGFMFINAYGTYVDLNTVIHEFGHFGAIMLKDASKVKDGGLNYDLAETQSQGLEILALPVLKNILPKRVYQDYVKNQISNIAYVIVVQALFDEFEQYVYNLTEQQLDDPTIIKTIKENYNRILGIVRSTETENYNFIGIPHFFASPLYCISYSVSLLTALQFGYAQFENSTPIQSYTNLLTYGDHQPFVETLTKVGLKSPFEQANITNASNYVKGLLNSVTTNTASSVKSTTAPILNFIPNQKGVLTLTQPQIIKAA